MFCIPQIKSLIVSVVYIRYWPIQPPSYEYQYSPSVLPKSALVQMFVTEATIRQQVSMQITLKFTDLFHVHFL